MDLTSQAKCCNFGVSTSAAAMKVEFWVGVGYEFCAHACCNFFDLEIFFLALTFSVAIRKKKIANECQERVHHGLAAGMTFPTLWSRADLCVARADRLPSPGQRRFADDGLGLQLIPPGWNRSPTRDPSRLALGCCPPAPRKSRRGHGPCPHGGSRASAVFFWQWGHCKCWLIQQSTMVLSWFNICWSQQKK